MTHKFCRGDRNVFHVDIYSLKVAGGIVLFTIGLTAITKGRFYEKDLETQSDDISIVPLAAPLIAGPGTITAAISFSAEHGVTMTMFSVAIAVAANFLIMCSALWIGKYLWRINATGPLIRIAGLIVAAVAVQMTLEGLREWMQ